MEVFAGQNRNGTHNNDFVLLPGYRGWGIEEDGIRDNEYGIRDMRKYRIIEDMRVGFRWRYHGGNIDPIHCSDRSACVMCPRVCSCAPCRLRVVLISR